jgi:hypothetical protein
MDTQSAMETATCIRCNREQPQEAMIGPYCHTCEHIERLNHMPVESPHKTALTIELRAVWERAYFAALTGLAGMARGDGEPAYSDKGAVAESCGFANATISAWPAMTAERDVLIAKVVKP